MDGPLPAPPASAIKHRGRADYDPTPMEHRSRKERGEPLPA
jgi:N,N-dimethylformamidase